MATKDYAYAVTKILDPEKKLFSDRVISRDECFDPHSKAPRLKYVNLLTPSPLMLLFVSFSGSS